MVQRTAALLRRAAATKVHWLDLRGAGLSVLERLLLEECLLQKDDRNWVICGHHEAVRHKYLRDSDLTFPSTSAAPSHNNNSITSSWDVDTAGRNESVAIVMGIGGKPGVLLNTDLVEQDQVLTLKRFSGGGTVVLDYDSIWTTVIGRSESSSSSNNNKNNEEQRQQPLVEEHFPRPIMEWSARSLFGPMFQKLAAKQKSAINTADKVQSSKQQTMVMNTVSCGSENSGRVVAVQEKFNKKETQFTAEQLPLFSLRENDYVFGERKIAGNAQSINKAGWLHHTSFLWDYQEDNMAYLMLPHKRPDYRGDRSHNDFLVKLKHVYPNLSKADFIGALVETCEDAFEVERVAMPEAMQIVNKEGGIKAWFQKHSRTKTVNDIRKV